MPADVPLEYPQPGDLVLTRRSVPPVIALPWAVPAQGTPAPHVHYLFEWALQPADYRHPSGGGVSRWGDLDLTRWRADTTLDDWGTWLYVQDRDSGALWSAAYQPPARGPSASDVRFYAHKAEFRRTDDEVALTMESPSPPMMTSESGASRCTIRVSAAPAGADQLRRGCHGRAAGRSTPRSLQQALHRERVSSRAQCAAVPSPAAGRERGPGLSSASGARSRRQAGAGGRPPDRTRDRQQHV